MDIYTKHLADRISAKQRNLGDLLVEGVMTIQTICHFIKLGIILTYYLVSPLNSTSLPASASPNSKIDV